MFANYLSAVFIFSVVMAKDIHRSGQNQVSPESELLRWESPEKFNIQFPFYLSGYDYDDRPVIVMEYGKWDTRHIADEGGEELSNLERRHDQFLERLRTGYFNKNTTERDEYIDEFVLILDYDGLNLYQLQSPANMVYLLKNTAKWEGVYENFAYGFIINSNSMVDELINLSRPFIANFLERTEIFGTNSNIWIPQILRNIPADQLPPAYGGNKDFKPAEFYG